MNIQEIQKELLQPHEMFYPLHIENGVFYLAYKEEQEETLRTIAKELENIFKDGDNSIYLNKASKDLCSLMIASSKLTAPLIFENTPFYNLDDLLFSKKMDEQVSLAFYIYDKQTDNSHKVPSEKDDKYAVVRIDEPTHSSVVIHINALFNIKSDEKYPDGGFEDELGVATS